MTSHAGRNVLVGDVLVVFHLPVVREGGQELRERVLIVCVCVPRLGLEWQELRTSQHKTMENGT